MLLRVIAHDLLSPLTAVKWQAELLARPDVNRAKRDAYIESIRASNELGIIITKHAHVAGSVLTKSYVKEEISLVRSEVMREVCIALTPQFERHGIVFSHNIEAESEKFLIDRALISLLVWSVSKFFLACVPTGGKVHVTGGLEQGQENNAYILEIGSDLVSDPESLVQVFTQQVPRNSLDQEYVFALLAHSVVEMLSAATLTARVRGTGITIGVRCA
jgi:signal transduction histidine kinase